MAAWRNGIASDYDVRCNQEIAGSTPAVVIIFHFPSLFINLVNVHLIVIISTFNFDYTIQYNIYSGK